MDGHWKAYFELNGKSVEDTTAFLLELSKGATRYAWYYHPNGRQGKGPHIHGWLYGWPKTAETLRNAGKAFFGLTQKHQFGISNKYDKGKVMSEDSYLKYIQYMTKGKFEPLCYYGIDKETLDARKQIANETYPEQVDNANEVIMRTKTSRITQYQIARIAQSQFMDEYPEDYIRDNGYNANKLVNVVIDVLKNNHKLAHKMQVRNIVQDIQADIDRTKYVSDIVKML